jgi:hypothetical protein
MPIPTLITTVGGVDSNSFGTLAEADLYHASVLHASAPWPPDILATAQIGSGVNGVVSLTILGLGTGGNLFTIQVVAGVGNDIPLSVSLIGTAITVTLGTDGAGLADPTKNTALLVTLALNALTGVSATYTGDGTGIVIPSIAQNFTGGDSKEAIKIPALIMAAQLLSTQIDWTGYAVTWTQRLPWPRYGMFQRVGQNYVNHLLIPEELKNAQFELARLLIHTDRTIENEIETQGLTSLRAGSVTLKFRENGPIGAPVIPQVSWSLLHPDWYVSIIGITDGTRSLERT